MIVRRGKRPQRNYTIISNDALRDENLSFRARGILCCILSYPEGFQIDSRRLATAGREGRDAIQSAMRELEARKYLLRRKFQDERGRWKTEATVYDEPMAEDLGWGEYAGTPAPENPASAPEPENPAPVNRAPENPALIEDGYKDYSTTTTRASALRWFGMILNLMLSLNPWMRSLRSGLKRK